MLVGRGQRSVQLEATGINTSLFGGIAHTVALAGMSSPSTAAAPTGNANTAPQMPVGCAFPRWPREFFEYDSRIPPLTKPP
jgi:hypothetical protein